MPCPFFEPRSVASEPRDAHSRVPLLDEYEGVCHAKGEPFRAPDEFRSFCNHGYSREKCVHFPSEDSRSCVRFDIVGTSRGELQLLCLEEHDYTPLRWQVVRCLIGSKTIEPELNDLCMRAQVLAFCRSYWRRFTD
ncbi:MAG: hypothetical protein M3Y72_20925 [Acidobacteriota bacterium]|nr:hypothetical protein [Acidobacteriota bacterium]